VRVQVVPSDHDLGVLGSIVVRTADQRRLPVVVPVLENAL
jgi:hypothetical protein